MKFWIPSSFGGWNFNTLFVERTIEPLILHSALLILFHFSHPWMARWYFFRPSSSDATSSIYQLRQATWPQCDMHHDQTVERLNNNTQQPQWPVAVTPCRRCRIGRVTTPQMRSSCQCQHYRKSEKEGFSRTEKYIIEWNWGSSFWFLWYHFFWSNCGFSFMRSRWMCLENLALLTANNCGAR